MIHMLVAMIMLIAPVGAITYGPSEIEGITTMNNVPLSTNETTIEHVEKILGSYYYVDVVPENNRFDCSNMSHIIWWVLTKHGYDAKLVGNYKIEDNKLFAHMFVWVNTTDGIIVIDSWATGPWTGDALGVIDRAPSPLLQSGWVWDTPEEFNAVGTDSDITNITRTTTINELPIRRYA